MKLVHLSDTHLGYRGQGIEKMVDDPWRPVVPIRQREADLMLGLIRAVDRILEQPHPDVVLHSGNLFDTARNTSEGAWNTADSIVYFLGLAIWPLIA